MIRLLPALLALSACQAPDSGDAFTHVTHSLVDNGAEANDRFIAQIEAAEDTLHIALTGIEDPDLADAIVAAWDRGLQVEVVVDADRRDGAGVTAVAEAGVPLQYADDGITYFDFSTNRDVSWSSEQTNMTHSFVVADRTQLVMADTAGDLGPGTRVVFEGRSEDLGEDLMLEHIQVFGGSDATAMTAFSAPAKSMADARWAYPTQDDEILEVWFNPQERTVKRIIDSVYGARASIRVMTEDFSDEGLARALQRKVEDGFDIEVLVGTGFGSASGAVSDVLRNQAPDVPLLQATTTGDPLPTMVFIDFDRARDGAYHTPKVLVLTHPIWSAARIYAGVEVVTDQLADGALYALMVNGRPTQPLQDLATVYAEKRRTAEVLR